VSAREIEQRVIRRQELARRLALGGIATALRDRGIREVAVDHETVTLQRLDGELEPPGSGRPIDIARPCHDAASIARPHAAGQRPARSCAAVSLPVSVSVGAVTTGASR
jgi:hypothetical protein